MTIRREDLVTAAALGLLQYRQVDPLLVFLLQQDVRAKRQALLAQGRQPRYGRIYTVLSCVLVVLVMVTAGLFAFLFSSRGGQPSGTGTLVFFTATYAAGALALTAWFNRRGHSEQPPTLSVLAMASVPLAVFILAQLT